MIGKVKLVAAVSCVAIGGLGISAMASDEQQLQREVTTLRSQVNQLQQQQTNSADVAATVDRILRDADARTQLIAEGDSGAGYDNGFFIRSGSFVMRPGFNMQVRNITDYRQDTSGNKADEIENGFEIRRMQFNLQGTAITKDLYYFFQTESDRNSGSVALVDAYIKYSLSDQFAIRAGQFKEQFTHEKIISDSKLLAVDRSLMDATIGGNWFDRVQGVNLIYGGQAKDNPLNIEVGYNDGTNSDNTDYTGHYPNDPALISQTAGPGGHSFDWGMAARVEYKAMGAWSNYGDFNGFNVKEDLLVFGAGFEMNQGGNGDTMAGTLDLAYKAKNGIGVYLAGLVRTVQQDVSNMGEDQTDWGLTGTLSYLINPAMEAFVRYSFVEYDNDVAFVRDAELFDKSKDFQEVSIGMAYYLGKNGEAGNRAKVTVDLSWLPSGAPAGLSAYGFYGDSNGQDEIVLRGVFQIAL
jgi:hypothetical protein